MTQDEVHSKLKLNELDDAKKKLIEYQGCSAKNGEGVWEGLAKLCEQLSVHEKQQKTEASKWL